MKLPLVVSAEQIKENDQSNFKVVDLRPIEAFKQGHLPNAVHLDASLLNRSATPVGGLLPDLENVNLLAETIGLQAGDHVVAYDQGAGTAAARLIWVLHAYGFTATSWLNGGYGAWTEAGLPVSMDEPTLSDSGSNGAGNTAPTLTFTSGNVTSVDELMGELNTSGVQVLDVRSTPEFDGTDVRSARGGHVPTAVHNEWTNVFDAQGVLKNDDELRKMFSSLGIEQDKHTVVYCQTHQRSAVTYVVLKHLQYKHVSAIDGAWSAWGSRDDTPIE